LARLRGQAAAGASTATFEALQRRLGALEVALAAEVVSRGVLLNSVVDGRTSLGQRVTRVEDILQSSVDKLVQADAMHAKLTIALDALQSQFASEPPDTVQHRLGLTDSVHAALAAEKDAREAHQSSLVDRHAMLEQGLTDLEGTLQNSVEKHGHADAIHAKLTCALGALQDQSASESSLRGTHPDTVQQRLDALEKVSDELTMEASAREA
jgi:hypothetical protein